MISVEHVTYSYPEAAAPVLVDVCWQVDAGALVVMAGPSAAGKSTLLRCLNGLVPHFSGGVIRGRITVGGLDALTAGPGALSALVGFVSQNPEAQAVLDQVEPEIAFALENAAVPPDEMRLRVEEALALLDLTPLRHRRLTTLSGGERQRVAIAAALVLQPQVLVLDEPTSQLDPQSAEDVLRALVRLNEDLGLTVILAEHRLERVLRYADRLTYMEAGKIVVDGPVREAAAKIPLCPPLTELGRRLGWEPLPLTIKEGRRFVRHLVATAPNRDQRPRELTAPKTHAQPVLRAESVRYAYNGRPALNGVSLQLQPGEVVALMGRNGSGKSTLLKCIIGLLSPSDGRVELHGRANEGRAVADICREVAYLPQHPDDLLFAESVADELAITLHNHRMPEQGILDLLSQLGLADAAAAYPRDLSVGQRQRVALGAVTVTRPAILLLDEPTRGLDYQAKQRLVSLLHRWSAGGMGILLVTHDVELTAALADRVILLSEGEVIAAGQTADVLTASPLFAPQIAKLFPHSGWLTVQDALIGLGAAARERHKS
ncbi:MAG: ABC transporter ATP-binding protein [Anaerolineae bacterium]